MAGTGADSGGRGPPHDQESRTTPASAARAERRASSAAGDSNYGTLGPEEVALSDLNLRNQSLTRSMAPSQSSTAPLTPQRPTRPTISVTRPGTNERGYSLRRALFQRGAGEEDGEGIELAEAGPSNQSSPAKPSRNRLVRFISSNDVRPKKGPRVQVSEVVDDLPKSEPPKKNFVLADYHSWAQRGKKKLGFVSKIEAKYDEIRKRILKIQEIPPSKDGRHIDLDTSRKSLLIDERTNKEYVTNMINSCRYSLWNFLPRQLIFQFGKLANFYFLIISILQMIPGLSTTGTYTTIVPLLVFISISMAKEGYDDIRRYKLDKAENRKDTKVLVTYSADVPPSDQQCQASSDGRQFWATVKWQDVKVGDVVKLDRNDPVPADMVILSSEGMNNIAYIETMALDGETNLKPKQPSPLLAKHCRDVDSISVCNAHIVVEDPNLDLYNFDGKVTIGGETLPIGGNEVVYRGSILRNTPSAIGMVINTGEECKIRMNANKNPRIKAPSLQAIVNKVVIIIVLFVLFLAAFNTVAYQLWSRNVESKSWYLLHAKVAPGPILMGFIIMFNTMIPLSLYVSLEIIKLGQLYLMGDVEMYDPVSNTPMEAHTSTINEELGQVSYIFSDKTGTLTDNVMRFRKLSVAGYAWLHDFDLKNDAGEAAASQKLLQAKKERRKASKARRPSMSFFTKNYTMGASLERTESSSTTPIEPQWKSSARPAKSQPELRTAELLEYLKHMPNGVFARKARFFLLSLALCHTCLPETQKDGSIDYQAASPDELALVRAAQELGYMVVDRGAQTITVKTQPGGPGTAEVREVYEILDVIEFTSARKRMSIVVRFPDGRRCIFCKGADSAVVKRLRQAPLAIQKAVEVERRATLRKDIEVEHALRRKSEAVVDPSSIRGHDNRKSFASIRRPSTAAASMESGRTKSFANLRRASAVTMELETPVTRGIGKRRASFATMRRPSVASNAKWQPIRDELDMWLKEQEADVDLTSVDNPAAYATPRSSMQSARYSSDVGAGNRSDLDFDYYDDLVDESVAVNDAAVFERCFQHIEDFATEGLRTLLYAYRFVDEQEYLGWKKVYLDATTSLVDRQELTDRAGDMIEQNFELSGATAIEDKLQNGVPETIDKLRRANIKMWMLTGDKRETAINIGHSCRLIKDYSKVIILDSEDGHVEQVMASALLELVEGSVPHAVVVVDGGTLNVIEADETLALLFFDLAVLADSVICCRASPSQKALLVRKIREKINKSVTLAIGDGANDIAMIQEAHVGIGITGKEGLQAARISDYAIAQFRFLSRLLLVHGRWNYIRTGKYVLGTFWKEMLFYLTQALYQRWNGYSGTSLYESWSLSMFNTLFTSLPVILLGIFEQDLEASTLLAVPELYTWGQHNSTFNYRKYFAWMFMGSSEAILIYFLMYGLFAVQQYGRDNGIFAIGDLSFSCCVIIINTKLLFIEMHRKTYICVLGWLISVIGWTLWNILLSLVYSDKESLTYAVRSGFVSHFGGNGHWWFVLVQIVMAFVVFELGVSAIRKAYWPTDVDLFQEFEKDPVIKRRFQDAAAGLVDTINAEEKKEARERAGSVVESPADSRTGGSFWNAEGGLQPFIEERPEISRDVSPSGGPRATTM